VLQGPTHQWLVELYPTGSPDETRQSPSAA
jgi:hypothetical protein